MLLRYVTPPTNKEVLAELPGPQADKLSELLKKHSLADIEAIHRERKNKLDKQYIAAQSRTKTLEEQLLALPWQYKDLDVESAKADIDKLDQKISEIRKQIDSVDENNRKINELQAKIKTLFETRDRMRQQFITLKNEPIEDTCRVCRQPLKGEAIEAAKADKQRRLEQFKAEFHAAVKQRQQLENELAVLEYIDVSEKVEQIRSLENTRKAIADALMEKERRNQLEQQIEKAKADEQATLESLRESTFILDSIKAFRAKEAELQAAKVQGLFTTLSIRLFEQQKNGELRPTFEIEYDGRPYSKLSLSEGIRAGLELRDVLSEQSGIVAPCFIDNAESITHFRRPKGQLIISRVVAGQELTIETGDAG